jgi:subtilisin family serine protease
MMSPADGQQTYQGMDDPLVAHRARVLDPSQATRIDDRSIQPTTYVADSVLVEADPDSDGVEDLRGWLREAKHVEATADPENRRVFDARPDRSREIPWVTRLRLAPAEGRAVRIDAWTLIQEYRAAVLRARRDGQGSDPVAEVAGDQEATAEAVPEERGDGDVERPVRVPVQVGLDHLMAATILGQSLTVGGTKTVGIGVSDQYALPGLGGRTPVAYVGPAPVRRKMEDHDRPVVVLLDTGIGDHDWLSRGVTIRPALLATDPERTGAGHDELEGGLGDFSGHGTFIAGLIRQVCPDADLLTIHVMDSHGLVEESAMITALEDLGNARARGDQRIDAISMSFGYYHEAEDEAKTASLHRALERLVTEDPELVLVASAGNDATNRPMLPAGFTDIPRLTSVGATNPNDTVALFSNAGAWVDTFWHGAQLLSTLPVGFNGSIQPTARTTWEGQTRESLDLDDFSSGFATWSGTSFAAPAFLGHCLRVHQSARPPRTLSSVVDDVAAKHRR